MGILEKSFFGEERKKIADQIKNARRSERLNTDESYGIDRTGKEYLYRIGGLHKLFKYLRGLPSKKILDIGTGNGDAIRVIGRMPMASGFNIEVTALLNTPELQRNIPKEKKHITAMETLRGIPDSSIAAVIGCNSIGYSDLPLLAVRRLNQVLIPGGVVKATFYTIGGKEEHDGTTFKDPIEFINGFRTLGYDLAYKDHLSMTTEQSRLINSIMIAIKPGNTKAPSAIDLLNADLEDIKEEAIYEVSDIPFFDVEDDY